MFTPVISIKNFKLKSERCSKPFFTKISITNILGFERVVFISGYIEVGFFDCLEKIFVGRSV